MNRAASASVLALSLALSGGSASAAEWDVRIGGEYLSYFGYASSDVDTNSASDFDGFDVKSDVTIAFMPEITLDNGIQFGAVVEVDGQDASVGDSFLFVDSSFGFLELGSRPSAGYNMFYSAPDESLLGTNDGSSGDFIPFDEMAGSVFTGNDTGLGTLNSTFIENGANENDNAQRISYYTPRFAGVQVGMSYARDRQATQNTQVDLNGDDLNNIIDIGVNYVQEFGDAEIAVAGRYGIAQNDTVGGENPEVWGVGGVVSYGGFSVGGSFSEQNNTSISDGQAYDAGVSYSVGPWAMSLTYQYGRNADDEQANAALAVPAGSDEELQQFVAGVTYELAEGVALGGFAAYVEFDEEVADSGAAGGDDVDGFIIGGGVALEF
ncbi:MAG: porin [Pseudomonadota bacterium]